MKKLLIIQIIMIFTVIACAQSVATVGVNSIDTIPNAKYTMYLYVAPSSSQLRAAFLKSPDSDVEVVPYSVQITTSSATMDEAFTQVQRGHGFKRLSLLRVDLRGKTVGYLMVPERHSFARRYIEVNLYERNGKVYFVPSEQGEND